MISIEQIRQELTWKLRRDVLYPGEMIQHMGLDEDNEAIHFGAFKDDRLAGVISLFQNGADFQFRKLAVDPMVQMMGVGKSLLAHVIMHATENGGKRIWCNARITAIGFYIKYQFKLTGTSFSKKDITYMMMEKVIAETSPNFRE